jgi:hypothetical protein
MSYDTVALNENANTVPLPAAPPPPREGFSRSPTEDEIPVCPNCGDELGAGETKEKREIMFVRACGHVSTCFPLLFLASHDLCLVM